MFTYIATKGEIKCTMVRIMAREVPGAVGTHSLTEGIYIKLCDVDMEGHPTKV